MLGGPIGGGGGAERRFARVIASFQARNNSSHVFLITHPELTCWLKEASIPIGQKNIILTGKILSPPRGSHVVKRYFSHVGNSIRYSLMLRHLVRQHNIDILHFITPNLYFVPFLFLRGRRPKVVFSLVSYPAFLERIPRTSRLVFEMFYRGADVIDSLYRNFMEICPRHRRKTRVTPCSFTDYGRFFPEAGKEKWIVFAGRLEQRKNPLLLLESIAGIADDLRQRQWKCFIFGKGELEGAVRNFISSNNISDIVAISSAPDISGILNRSSIFVSLQKLENYPSQSLLEAMAAGNAIVATDVGDTRRLVDGETGVLLQEQSAEVLAAVLLRLIDDRPLRCSMGAKGRKLVAKTHTMERWADYLDELWCELKDSTVRRTSC